MNLARIVGAKSARLDAPVPQHEFRRIYEYVAGTIDRSKTSYETRLADASAENRNRIGSLYSDLA